MSLFTAIEFWFAKMMLSAMVFIGLAALLVVGILGIIAYGWIERKINGEKK